MGGPGMMPLRRWLAYLATALVIVALIALGCRAAFDHSAEAPPEVILHADGYLAGGVQLGDEVIVATVDAEGVTFLSRYDQATGEERGRVALADVRAVEDIAAFEGSIILRLVGRLPGVAAVVLWWSPHEPVSLTEVWLVVVDGATLEPARQYRLPPVVAWVGPYEPLTLIDGTVWFHATGLGDGRIDLRTGRTDTRPGDDQPGIIDVGRDSGKLIVTRYSSIQIYDIETGEVDWYPNVDQDWAEPLGGFRFYDSQIWSGGLEPDDRYQYYRFDPESGEMADPVPWSDLPVWSFESGGYRWELFNPDSNPARHPAVQAAEGDRWRRVAVDSGEVIDVHDFGRYAPRFATDDFVWLHRRTGDGPGYELARLPLRPAR